MKTLLLCLMLTGVGSLRQQTKTMDSTALLPNSYEKELQKAALHVLETRCNVCHEKRNKRFIFTEQNMASLATKIQKQVFVLKRMPKGKNNHLNTGEREALKNWLENRDSKN